MRFFSKIPRFLNTNLEAFPKREFLGKPLNIKVRINGDFRQATQEFRI
jgi:hypothetical protein